MFYKNFFKWFSLVLTLFISSQLFANDWLYTVRPNDSASSIGNKYLINPYRIDEVLKYNQIDNVQALTAGTVLKVPMQMLKFGPARVQVVSVQGQVEFLRNNQIQSLTTAHTIRLGDKILTKDNGSAMLRFADKSELLLGSNSELVFDVLTRWGRTGMVDSKMRLLKGSAEGRVEKLQGPGAHFEVHTPSAVATVRGTEFRVRIDRDNVSVTYNEVSEGKVKVDNQVSDLLIPQGFGVVSEAGKAADEAIELLEAPDFEQALDLYPAKPVTIAWSKNPQAQAYRVELFADNQYKQQLKTYLVKSTSINFNQVESGSYAVRVRAVDANGLEGLDAKHEFQLNQAPMAPHGLSAQETNLVGQELQLNWLPLENAENYEVEVARDEDFSDVFVVEPAVENSKTITADRLPGKYFWRVRGENKFGKGYYSEVATFISELPKIPSLNAVSDVLDSESAKITWEKVGLASGYQWQLATDDRFDNIIDSKTTSQTQLELENLAPGTYYFRVAAVGVHNKDRYSPAQSFEILEETNGKNPFMLSSLLLILLAL